MTEQRITDLAELGIVDDNDLVVTVDVSDTTDSPAGSSRRTKMSVLRTFIDAYTKAETDAEITNAIVGIAINATAISDLDTATAAGLVDVNAAVALKANADDSDLTGNTQIQVALIEAMDVYSGARIEGGLRSATPSGFLIVEGDSFFEGDATFHERPVLSTPAPATLDDHLITLEDLNTSLNDVGYTYVQATAPGSPSVGETWLDTDNHVVYFRYDPGDGAAWYEIGNGALEADITARLPLAGGVMSGNIDMGGNEINGLADPAAASDAVRKDYVDARASVFSQTSISHSGTVTSSGSVFAGSTTVDAVDHDRFAMIAVNVLSSLSSTATVDVYIRTNGERSQRMRIKTADQSSTMVRTEIVPANTTPTWSVEVVSASTVTWETAGGSDLNSIRVLIV
jgi:hypothetical protein